VALKTPVRVFRKSFPVGTSKSIDFAEAGFTAPLDNTYLLLAFIFVANTTVATFPGTWTSIYGGSTGNGPTQIRLIAMQGDGSTNSLTIGTASSTGSITLVAYPDFAGLTPITAASSLNVTTATATYNLPDFGSGTANGILFDVIGSVATFAGATYNRGTLVGDLDANGQMILAQEYTDGTADQSVTVTMPSSRQGRYSQVVMPIGVGSSTPTITTTATGGVAITGTADVATGSTIGRTATGGVTLTGAAPTTVVFTVTAGGSVWPPDWQAGWGSPTCITLGGTASAAEVIQRTAVGGVTLTGSASAAVVLSRTAAGSVTIVGSAPVVVQFTTTASGGVALSGTAEFGGSSIVRTATGGVILSGAATQGVLYASTASGGVTVGGTAVQVVTLARTASGGVILTGVGAVASGFATTATGGITLTGTAAASARFDMTAVGGLSLSGTGVVGMGAVTITRTAAGGIALTGIAYPSSSARLPRFIDLEQRPTLTLTLRD
jgi:hypothetical protein